MTATVTEIIYVTRQNGTLGIQRVHLFCPPLMAARMTDRFVMLIQHYRCPDHPGRVRRGMIHYLLVILFHIYQVLI